MIFTLIKLLSDDKIAIVRQKSLSALMNFINLQSF